jgi:hypothetical protein
MTRIGEEQSAVERVRKAHDIAGLRRVTAHMTDTTDRLYRQRWNEYDASETAFTEALAALAVPASEEVEKLCQRIAEQSLWPGSFSDQVAFMLRRLDAERRQMQLDWADDQCGHEQWKEEALKLRAELAALQAGGGPSGQYVHFMYDDGDTILCSHPSDVTLRGADKDDTAGKGR